VRASTTAPPPFLALQSSLPVENIVQALAAGMMAIGVWCLTSLAESADEAFLKMAAAVSKKAADDLAAASKKAADDLAAASKKAADDLAPVAAKAAQVDTVRAEAAAARVAANAARVEADAARVEADAARVKADAARVEANAAQGHIAVLITEKATDRTAAAAAEARAATRFANLEGDVANLRTIVGCTMQSSLQVIVRDVVRATAAIFQHVFHTRLGARSDTSLDFMLRGIGEADFRRAAHVLGRLGMEVNPDGRVTVPDFLKTGDLTRARDASSHYISPDRAGIAEMARLVMVSAAQFVHPSGHEVIADFNRVWRTVYRCQSLIFKLHQLRLLSGLTDESPQLAEALADEPALRRLV
jgi:hypothetical protein